MYSAYFQYFFDNITRKSQHIEQFGVQFKGTLRAGYELFYTINANNSQQISNMSNSKNEQNIGIGEITINTQATSSSEISSDIKSDLENQLQNLKAESYSGIDI